jgi:hypothetical protein
MTIFHSHQELDVFLKYNGYARTIMPQNDPLDVPQGINSARGEDEALTCYANVETLLLLCYGCCALTD